MRARLVTTLTLSIVLLVLLIIITILPTWMYESNTGGGTVHYGLFFDVVIRNKFELHTYTHDYVINQFHGDIRDGYKEYLTTAPFLCAFGLILGGLSIIASLIIQIISMASKKFKRGYRNSMIIFHFIGLLSLVFALVYSLTILYCLDGHFYPHMNFYIDIVLILSSCIILFLLLGEKNFDTIQKENIKDIMPPIHFK
jgi:hypothetical protein